MKCSRNWKPAGLLPTCLAGLVSLGSCLPAAAQGQPCVVRSLQAVTDRGATVIDIMLAGTTTATLQDDGNRLVVTLPKATAVPGLADHIQGAGVVSGIGLEDMGVGERVTLVLRSPSGGRIIETQDPHKVRVVVASPARLAQFSGAQPAHLAAPTPKPVPTQACFAAPSSTPPRLVAAETAMPSRTALVAVPEALPVQPAAAVLMPVAPAPAVRLYSVNAYQSDLAGVLNSLAQDAHVSIVMAGAVSSKVTMNLRQVPLEKAVDLLTKSAGLSYHRDGSAYVIGAAKDLAAAYPDPTPAVTRTVYRCLHVSATEVVAALKNMFDKDELRVSMGAAPSSPRLGDDASSTDVTGIQSSTVKSGDTTSAETNSHLIILAGTPDIVAQALDLAQKLDLRRSQVKIAVQITDIDRSALKNLGLQWTFGNLDITENQPNGIGFGSFTRSPLSVSATITALENSGDAKLLAAPNMSILDGEQGFILIGDRLQYPKLTGYTQAQTPIYDVTEERVGIYLQVAVQMEDNGEITLTLYPQVSTVSGYLNVNGASYPQISTREQQTTIRVKDGQQIVIGGLIQDEEVNNIQKVPILSDIPLFKELFTYRNTTKQQTEVVIVITPQILKD